MGVFQLKVYKNMNTFRHVGIVVRDLDISQKFYEKYFNFKVKRKMNEGGIFLENLLKAKDIKAKTTKMSDATKEVCLELLYFYKNKNFKQNKNKNENKTKIKRK